jgi:transposase-like protein
VTTDKAAIYPAVIDELAPAAFHDTTKYANNGCEADHGRLKARLRPMRGVKSGRTMKVIIAGAQVRRLHPKRSTRSLRTRRPRHEDILFGRCV